MALQTPRPTQEGNSSEANSTYLEREGSLREEFIAPPILQERARSPKPVLAYKESKEELKRLANIYLRDIKLNEDGSIKPYWHTTDLQVKLNSTCCPKGGYFYDIEIPGHSTTCKPRLSEIFPVGEKIDCENPNSNDKKICVVTREIIPRRTYATKLGYKVKASVDYPEDWSKFNDGVKEFTATLIPGDALPATWKHEWQPTKYKFHVPAGKSCTPSMMNVDLVCQVTKLTYNYDIWTQAEGLIPWYWIHDNNPTLEYAVNRHDPRAPYGKRKGQTGTQWCADDHLDVTDPIDPQTIYSSQTWPGKWIKVRHDGHEDGHRTNFGWVYAGSASDLSKYRTGWGDFPPFEEDELVIRDLVKEGHMQSAPNIVRCKPRSFEREKILVPLRGKNHFDGPQDLQGHIGCI